ncbi:hypothetical protein A2U01_0085681, partial [Trifolium medium]|nr:hypothetical protein [Trifolium medium]
MVVVRAWLAGGGCRLAVTWWLVVPVRREK